MANLPSLDALRQLSPALTARSKSFETCLKELVAISSYTYNRPGVFRVQRLIARELQSLGLQTKFFKGDRTDLAPLLVGEIEGKEDLWITLVCHADTVHEKKDMPCEVVKIDEKRFIGPGVIDNKGGVVVILEAIKDFLRRFPEKNHRRFGLRVVCSPSEEIGSPGLHHIFHHYSRRTIAVLGYEPSNSEGDLIGSRQGNRWYNLEVEGKEAHAGRDHHLGINAAHEIAIKACALENLTDYEAGLTVNIGHIEAGKKRHNVVAAKARALIDVRFRSLSQRQDYHQKVVTIFRENNLATHSSWKVVDDCPPFQKGPRSAVLFSLLKNKLIELEGREIKLIHAGGCADSNHFNREGMPIIDGLGPIGGKMHTNEEWIDVSSIATRAKASSYLFEQLMNHKEITYVPWN